MLYILMYFSLNDDQICFKLDQEGQCWIFVSGRFHGIKLDMFNDLS